LKIKSLYLLPVLKPTQVIYIVLNNCIIERKFLTADAGNFPSTLSGLQFCAVPIKNTGDCPRRAYSLEARYRERPGLEMRP